MSNCNCKGRCSGGCSGHSPLSCGVLCGDGSYLKAVDGNGDDILLSGEGIPYSDGSSVHNTDGSSEKGMIILNPDDSAAADSMLGLSGGALFRIGDEAPDGSSLVKRGGKWIVQSSDDKKGEFQSTELVSADTIAGFSCGTTGKTQRLGALKLVPGTILYINEDGKLEFTTIDALSLNLVTSLCSQIPEKPLTSEILGYIGCTEAGLAKVLTGSSYAYVTGKPRVYLQNKAYTVYTDYPNNYPPYGAFDVGGFVTNYVDINLTQYPGYSAKAHSVVLNIRAFAYAGASFSGPWGMLAVIDNMEYLRLTIANATAHYSNNNQVTVQIPSSKILRFTAIRAVGSGSGAGDEYASMAAYLEAFIS